MVGRGRGGRSCHYNGLYTKKKLVRKKIEKSNAWHTIVTVVVVGVVGVGRVVR